MNLGTEKNNLYLVQNKYIKGNEGGILQFQ